MKKRKPVAFPFFYFVPWYYHVRTTLYFEVFHLNILLKKNPEIERSVMLKKAKK